MNDTEFAAQARISGTAEEWDRFKAYLLELPPESGFVLLRVLGETLPIDAPVEDAVVDDLDVHGLIIAGAALMMRATRIRGYDTADRVRQGSWESYLACLARAEQLLKEALRLDLENGLAAAWRMSAAVDSDDDVKGEAVASLASAKKVPISGFSKLLSARTEKWGGSHEAMWDVARGHAEVNWPWFGALIAKAHYEHWLYLEFMDDRPAAEYEAEGYFRDPSVRDELSAISEAISEASTDDPYEAVYAHDVLAAVLTEAGMSKAAAKHLRQVGKFGDPALLTGGPWWRRVLVRIFGGLPPW